jgi:hypothetical protein
VYLRRNRTARTLLCLPCRKQFVGCQQPLVWMFLPSGTDRPMWDSCTPSYSYIHVHSALQVLASPIPCVGNVARGFVSRHLGVEVVWSGVVEQIASAEIGVGCV